MRKVCMGLQGPDNQRQTEQHCATLDTARDVNHESGQPSSGSWKAGAPCFQ